jgi:hypothetical protein
MDENEIEKTHKVIEDFAKEYCNELKLNENDSNKSIQLIKFIQLLEERKESLIDEYIHKLTPSLVNEYYEKQTYLINLIKKSEEERYKIMTVSCNKRYDEINKKDY